MRWSLLALTNQPSPSYFCVSLNDISTAIFPHIFRICPLLTILQNIFYASHNQNISKICMWMALNHSFFCQWSLKTAQNLLPCLYLFSFRFVLLSFHNCTLTCSVYCNKATEQHNRPPLKSTNKSLFPWLASAWLWCGVNIEFPNDGPCRL